MYNINIAHTHPIYFIDMKYNKEKIPLIFSLMVKAKFCLQGGGGYNNQINWLSHVWLTTIKLHVSTRLHALARSRIE